LQSSLQLVAVGSEETWDEKRGMNQSNIKRQRLAALFVLGLLLLNNPLLELFAGAGKLFGIPGLYLYVFVIWALLILLVALVVETGKG
jgi:hypothetical protein